MKNEDGRAGGMLSTKANTLNALSKAVSKSKIEKMKIITAGEFKNSPDDICRMICDTFGGHKIVVRSSSSNEDSYVSSNAGHYDSVLNVDSNDAESVFNAVAQVIGSYTDVEYTDDEQILIQRQTTDVLVSGVIFTREIHSNLPYYLISYDDNGSTDSVTSGRGGKTLMISRDVDISNADPVWRNLLESVREIEDILNDTILDIEFAVAPGGEVIIFQVRPLAVGRKAENTVSIQEFYAAKENIKREYDKRIDIFGEGVKRLSDMAFWNPAEIIGVNPRPLDYSLYREIITKDVWSKSLTSLGYKYIDEELMYQIGNKPYISLDYSFRALLPEDTDNELSDKIADFYGKYLMEDLTAHDKIEFEVVFSSYDFMTRANITRMEDYGFSELEINTFSEQLKKLTFGAVKRYKNILGEDVKSLKRLNKIREKAEADALKSDDEAYIAQVIISLLDDLKENGTAQFARQARYAFMAKAFCRTLIEAGYFNADEIDDFMESINTVSSDFDRDFALFGQGGMSRDEFNKRYGHLRSGTYNIRSRRYDAMDFENIRTKTRKGGRSACALARLDRQRLQTALTAIGFDIDADEFAAFLKSAMEQREYFKFEFTKTLSFIIELIALFGRKTGFTRKEMSWFCAEDFSILNGEYRDSEAGNAITSEKIRKEYKSIIAEREEKFNRNKKVILPDIILNKKDFDIIKIQEARPNFITSENVEGKVVVIDDYCDKDIEGKIVAVPQADPGYEWIFAKGIKGFVTQYGGVASHMAIRCAEFGIPGAIGCGKKIYDYVCRQDYIRLDCKNGKIM